MTTRGRTLAALAASTLVFGRLGGMRELVMAGAAFALVLGIGFALVWARGGRVAAHRSVTPTHVFVGGQVRVELTIEATGRFGLGPLLLADRIPRALGPGPHLALSGGGSQSRGAASRHPAQGAASRHPAQGAASHRTRAVAYTITPRMRGRYSIGPLELTHTDPFGSVHRTRSVPGTSHVMVLPSFEEISALPTGVQRAGIVRSSPLVGQGDEFYALRAYEEGDDLRKIHWPTSLKIDQLVVRQEELLAEPRALIVLDTIASKHRGRGPTSSLEAAVSACASVGILALRRRMRIDVLTPDGSLLSHRTPSELQLLHALALVQPSRRKGMANALQRTAPQRLGRPALVVVISPDLKRDELRALAARAKGSAAGAFILIDAASFERSTTRTRRPPVPDIAMFGLPAMRLRAGDSFRHVWQSGIHGVSLAR